MSLPAPQRRVNMKVAIATKDQNPETRSYKKFSRCTSFFIFDTVSGSYEVIENTAAHLPLGAGNAAAQLIYKNDVHAVIAGYYSPFASNALQRLGIKMYLSAEEKVWTVYDKFKNNLLVEANASALAGQYV